MVLISWFDNYKISSKLLIRRLWSSSSSNNNCYYDFPEEILIEILCRLPADRLLLFKSVCRHWNSLISSPYSLNLHLRITISQLPSNTSVNNNITIFMFTYIYNNYKFGIYDNGGLLRSTSGGRKIKKKKKMMIRRISLPEIQSNNKFKTQYGYPYHLTIRLIGSCDGLLVFDRFYKDSSYTFIIRHIFIINPITRETRIIKYPQGSVIMGYVCGIFFDRFQNEHKLLHVSKIGLALEYHIFSFTENVWTTLSLGDDEDNYVPPCMHISPPVIVNDALHWIIMDAHPPPPPPHGFSLSSKVGMAFKIETKEIYYFPHPMVVTSEKRKRHYCPTTGTTYSQYCDACCFKFSETTNKDMMQLIERNGQLCFCHIVVHCDDVIDLWVLEEYGNWNSWIKSFTVKLPHVIRINGCYSSSSWGSTILSFPHQDIIAVKRNPKKIYLYHLVTHKLSRIDDLPMASCSTIMLDYRFLAFKKTLLSPNSSYMY